MKTKPSRYPRKVVQETVKAPALGRSANATIGKTSCRCARLIDRFPITGAASCQQRLNLGARREVFVFAINHPLCARAF